MHRVEPAGSARTEIYLCRILAVLMSGGFGGSDQGFRKLMIGYEEPEQTMEQALAEFNKSAF